jgi:ribosomal protein S18 acetylase RimI-like enzyme
MIWKVSEFFAIDDALVGQVDAIEKTCFNDASRFPTEEIGDILKRSQIRGGIYDGEKLVGYCVARYAFRVGYLYSTAVLPEYQGRGLGRMLLNWRLDELERNNCRVIQAHTMLDNIRSGALLNKAGFIPVQYVPDFYEDNVDAILWCRS